MRKLLTIGTIALASAAGTASADLGFHIGSGLSLGFFDSGLHISSGISIGGYGHVMGTDMATGTGMGTATTAQALAGMAQALAAGIAPDTDPTTATGILAGTHTNGLATTAGIGVIAGPMQRSQRHCQTVLLRRTIVSQTGHPRSRMR